MNFKKMDLNLKLTYILAIAMIITFVIVSFATEPKKSQQSTSTATTTTSEESSISTSTNMEFEKMSESDIKFDNKKINIYVFFGDGCPHCAALANYLLADIPAEYKDYYNVYSFEVWYDDNNKALMQQFATAINYEVSGVPFMVIGNKHLSGYSSGMNDQLLSIIKEQYDNKNNTNTYTDIYKQIKGM
jgi:protein-disulfide isomerase